MYTHWIGSSMRPLFVSNDTKQENYKSKMTNSKQALMTKIQNSKQDKMFEFGDGMGERF